MSNKRIKDNERILQDAIDGKRLNRWLISSRRHELLKIIKENPDKWGEANQRILDEIEYAKDSL